MLLRTGFCSVWHMSRHARAEWGASIWRCIVPLFPTRLDFQETRNGHDHRQSFHSCRVPATAPRTAVYIEGCSVEQKPMPCRKGLFVTPGASDIQIRYSAIALFRARQVQVNYRLAGLDEKWVNSGSESVITFSHLLHRNYRFLVRAVSCDGIWTPTPTSLFVTIKPAIASPPGFERAPPALLSSLTAVIGRSNLTAGMRRSNCSRTE